MNLTQAARSLAVSPKFLRLAAERGEIQAEHPLADGPWIFNRSALRTDAARALAGRARGHRVNLAGQSVDQQNLFNPTTSPKGAV